MFGMEKNNNKGKLFEFDLEKDIQKDPKKAKQILDEVTIKLHDIKEAIRSGASKEDFENYGILLKGYTALQKVLTKATKK